MYGGCEHSFHKIPILGGHIEPLEVLRNFKELDWRRFHSGNSVRRSWGRLLIQVTGQGAEIVQTITKDDWGASYPVGTESHLWQTVSTR